MKMPSTAPRSGFTLIETVIAIGVLAVLLSGFLVVFAPAADGIRKSLNSQDAARMVATLEEELVTLRGTNQKTSYPTGFDKAFDFIRKSAGNDEDFALLVYKYRGSLASFRPADGTPEQLGIIGNQIPGKDYVVQNMMRRRGDPEFFKDLPAIEGPVYLVKCTQLYMQQDGTELKLMPGDAGVIVNPSASEPRPELTDPDAYTQAVITFRADFFALPAKTEGYFNNQFANVFLNANKPVFSRNLAVRR